MPRTIKLNMAETVYAELECFAKSKEIPMGHALTLAIHWANAIQELLLEGKTILAARDGEFEELVFNQELDRLKRAVKP